MWYDLKEKIGNNEFYKLILGAGQHQYNYTVHTDMESLSIGDIDEYELDLYQELDEILCKGSAYEIIGFLMMNSIDVKGIDVIRKTNDDRIKLNITKEAIFSDGCLQDLKDTVAYLGFNPEFWIGDEIKAAYIV